MSRKHLVSLFYFNDNIAGKDMFLAPKYLADALDMDCQIVFPKWKENEHLKGEYRGVKLTPIKSKSCFNSTIWTEKEMLWWLICHARKIDVLSLFWLNPRNLIFARIYKIINPKGVCWIKGDFNEISLREIQIVEKKTYKTYIKDFFYRAIDLVSAETKLSVECIKQEVLGKHLSRCVAYMPNAFDIQLFEKSDIKRKQLLDKENLIITVGRIGHPDKNSEMVLNALNGVDMKGWKFWFVGPVDNDFLHKYEQFIANNPDKIELVKLLGAINVKTELWQIYNRAKLFVLTSPKEGFPNVFPEALYFGNYIVTTDVASAVDITNNQVCGTIIPIGDVMSLRDKLNEFFCGNTELEEGFDLISDYSKQFEWANAVKEVALCLNDIVNEKNN